MAKWDASNPLCVTQEELKSLYSYCSQSGLFTRKVCIKTYPAGSLAGCRLKSGYIFIVIRRHRYSCHRLAWLYTYGEWPEKMIDHINGNPSDNRICNLRKADHSENGQNLRGLSSRNTSGYLGVHKCPNVKGKWSATICVRQKDIFIGNYNSPEEAYSAYLEAKRKLHPACTI